MNDKSVEAKSVDSKKIDDYQVDDAVHTLLKAEEIKKDAALMKLVHKKLAGKSKAIKSVQQLRGLQKEMQEGEAE